jgi:UDP-4-amino-4-deoxy-L-arabinose formyltransferase/UDP-glucuronic acid dehydrogenase (UDP-4-keto-hexauronic acid decarboxylating)
MRTVVLAYHEVGCAGLESLVEAGADVRAVFTHDDDPGENVWFSSVAQLGSRYGLKVYAPERINDAQWVEVIRNCEPDLLFSFYYRKIVSSEILAVPLHGCYNLHGSLLPRFRGRSPTNWAILMGEKKTGVTLHRMVPRADAGDIVGQMKVDIGEEDEVRTVLMKQVEATRALLTEVYPQVVSGQAIGTPQDERLATKFGGRRSEDGAIDWNQSAESIHNLVRAVTYPWPGGFSVRRGQKCIIWRTRRYVGPTPVTLGKPGDIVSATDQGVLVACGSGFVEILQAQVPPGPWVDGSRLKDLLAPMPGCRFGSD